ncbi:MAG: carboxypeptidase-like regulatory domain-containing protein, partial [Bacteroidales bacterium]|nr:carboxypeptidase-like regulatory domain-containing protein [Bacteroidales bacterium]
MTKTVLKKLLILAAGLLLAGLQPAFAQQERISGKVSDENGEPVPGAAVFYDGTSTATMTDSKGNFSIPFL